MARGETLVEQGKLGHDLFVLLDGVFDVEIDGRRQLVEISAARTR